MTIMDTLELNEIWRKYDILKIYIGMKVNLTRKKRLIFILIFKPTTGECYVMIRLNLILF